MTVETNTGLERTAEEELRNLIDRFLAGDLSEDQADELSTRLRNDENARALFLQMSDIHACLAVDESLWAQPAPASSSNPEQPTGPTWNVAWMCAIAATLIALLTITIVLWPQNRAGKTFATMTQTRAAFWESGELPTANGSRLGKGTLRLAEGMATLKFDSGAEVTLEAPATLTLIDSMNCELSGGTAVSDVPESALGFRVRTPSADVVDYGTRFAVSVYEETGETHTQVIEGKVQVEFAGSDKVVELNTGQHNLVTSKSLSEATDAPGEEHRTIPVEPLDHGPDWTLLEPVKDAYTGRVKGHESDVLLFVKNGKLESSPHREAYLGFNLSDIDQSEIVEAELLLFFAPTGWGLASLVPDSTFSLYGMTGHVPEWDESILHGQFPGDPELVHLGSFTIPQGMQKGRHSIKTDALSSFLRQNSASEITFKVVRDTKETESSGLVHGFASRRHPVLPAPTLAIRKKAE